MWGPPSATCKTKAPADALPLRVLRTEQRREQTATGPATHLGHDARRGDFITGPWKTKRDVPFGKSFQGRIESE